MNTEIIEEIKDQVAFVLNEYHEKGGRCFCYDDEIIETIEDVFFKNQKVKYNGIDVFKEEDRTITLKFKEDPAVLIIECNEKWESVRVKLTGEYTFESCPGYSEGLILY